MYRNSYIITNYVKYIFISKCMMTNAEFAMPWQKFPHFLTKLVCPIIAVHSTQEYL